MPLWKQYKSYWSWFWKGLCGEGAVCTLSPGLYPSKKRVWRKKRNKKYIYSVAISEPLKWIWLKKCSAIYIFPSVNIHGENLPHFWRRGKRSPKKWYWNVLFFCGYWAREERGCAILNLIWFRHYRNWFGQYQISETPKLSISPYQRLANVKWFIFFSLFFTPQLTIAWNSNSFFFYHFTSQLLFKTLGHLQFFVVNCFLYI